MTDYLTYLYLLTPLHTGGSSNEGNLMGIAREVHTEFPYCLLHHYGEKSDPKLRAKMI